MQVFFSHWLSPFIKLEGSFQRDFGSISIEAMFSAIYIVMWARGFE